MNLASARGGEASRTAACQQVIAGLIPSHSASFRVIPSRPDRDLLHGFPRCWFLRLSLGDSGQQRSEEIEESEHVHMDVSEMGVPPNHPFPRWYFPI